MSALGGAPACFSGLPSRLKLLVVVSPSIWVMRPKKEGMASMGAPNGRTKAMRVITGETPGDFRSFLVFSELVSSPVLLLLFALAVLALSRAASSSCDYSRR